MIVNGILDRLHAEFSIPMLYVSHSIEEVSRLCDYMLILDQGKIIFNGDIHDALVSCTLVIEEK